MRRILTVAVILLVGLVATAPSARADEVISEIVFIDPATLHIGTGAGTPCATGCGGDPNIVGGTFSLYQNSGGAPTLGMPLLLIVGIPNASGPAPSLTGITSYYPYSSYPTSTGSVAWAYASNGTYGLSGGAGGYFGSFTSGSPQVYDFLGLQGPTDHSNNWGNWSTAYFNETGNTASSFGMYVFALNTNLPSNGLLDIVASGLPNGSIAIGYGQHIESITGTTVLTADPTCPSGYSLSGGVCRKVVGTPSQGHCPAGQVKVGNTCVLQATPTCSAGYTLDNGTCKKTVTTSTTTVKIYDTPFTEAGMTTVVPEPGTFTLLGLGLVGLGRVVRRRRL